MKDAPTPSAMRSGKFTSGRNVTEIESIHDHKHKKIFIEGSIDLSDDQKHIKFTMKMQGLYEEAQKVDGTIIINPIASGAK